MEKEHFEILLEEMDSKFKLLAEGIAGVNESLTNKIDELARRTDERFDLVDLKFQALDQTLSKRIDEVDERLSKRIDEVEANLSTKIDAVAADLSAHRADTEAHRGAYRVMERE